MGSQEPELVALRVSRGFSAADESEVHFRNWMPGSAVQRYRPFTEDSLNRPEIFKTPEPKERLCPPTGGCILDS